MDVYDFVIMIHFNYIYKYMFYFHMYIIIIIKFRKKSKYYIADVYCINICFKNKIKWKTEKFEAQWRNISSTKYYIYSVPVDTVYDNCDIYAK